MNHEKLLKIIEILSLILVPVALLLCAWLRIEQTALLTALVAALALVPFFVRFEHQRPKPRDIMPIVVLSAVAAVGRIIFAPFPSFKPVTAICIIAGISFGRQAGFLVGALAALASNMFFGQGPFTPWQMYAWGLIGYLAGALFENGAPLAALREQHPSVVFAFGAFSALLYGFILDSWTLVGYVNPVTPEAALLLYGAGLPFSLTQMVATIVFLIPTLKPWGRMFEHFKIKYGIQR